VAEDRLPPAGIREKAVNVCYRCRKEVVIPKIVGRKDVCPSCQADLRCCLNCCFYDARVYNQCRESQAERVLDKDRSNFCDYFSFREADSGPEPEEKQVSKDKLEALFKK
jgi:hypothetical protein